MSECKCDTCAYRIISPKSKPCLDCLHNYPNNVDLISNYDRYQPEQSDPINSPKHYTQGAVECITCIQSALTAEEFRGYCKGNIIKYAFRERNKGGDQDIKKAAWYAEKLLETEP